jgi:hypothetical protein
MRRSLTALRQEKQLTVEGLWRAGAGVSPLGIKRWETTGEPPAEARARCIAVARALEVPLDHLDLGVFRRGFSEAGAHFVLCTRARDGHGWDAWVESWEATDAWASSTAAYVPVARVNAPTAISALDALEAKLRDLHRTAPPDSGFIVRWIIGSQETDEEQRPRIILHQHR